MHLFVADTRHGCSAAVGGPRSYSAAFGHSARQRSDLYVTRESNLGHVATTSSQCDHWFSFQSYKCIRLPWAVRAEVTAAVKALKVDDTLFAILVSWDYNILPHNSRL